MMSLAISTSVFVMPRLSPALSTRWRFRSRNRDFSTMRSAHRDGIVRGYPHDVLLHSNMLFALRHHPQTTARSLNAELTRWVDRHAKTLMSADNRHANARDPDRPLRVGYVSPYFREHAITFFFEPILHITTGNSFRRSSTAMSSIRITSRLGSNKPRMSGGHGWHERLPALADLVRRDRVGILVDLTSTAAEAGCSSSTQAGAGAGVLPRVSTDDRFAGDRLPAVGQLSRSA